MTVVTPTSEASTSSASGVARTMRLMYSGKSAQLCGWLEAKKRLLPSASARPQSSRSSAEPSRRNGCQNSSMVEAGMPRSRSAWVRILKRINWRSKASVSLSSALGLISSSMAVSEMPARRACTNRSSSSAMARGSATRVAERTRGFTDVAPFLSEQEGGVNERGGGSLRLELDDALGGLRAANVRGIDAVAQADGLGGLEDRGLAGRGMGHRGRSARSARVVDRDNGHGIARVTAGERDHDGASAQRATRR